MITIIISASVVSYCMGFICGHISGVMRNSRKMVKELDAILDRLKYISDSIPRKVGKQ